MSYPSPNQPGYPPVPYGQPQPIGNYYPPPYPQPSQPSGYPSPATAYVAQPQSVIAQPQPIVVQPTAGQGQAHEQGPYGPQQDSWMAIPAQVPSSYPAGLRYLASVDQLLVKQETEFMEMIVGVETNNRYTVKNNLGQRVFYAIEDNDWFTRMCCGTLRSFDIRIMDNYGQEVIHAHRDFRCNSCWCPCCLQKMTVYSPPGTLAGTVEQNWSLFYPSFDVKDEFGQKVLKIEGPICQYSLFCRDIEYKVLSVDESAVVGKISKKWSGLLREYFTDADFFGITFPLDLDIRMKAVMLSACFLIDFMYFEDNDTRATKRDPVGLRN